MKPRRGGGLLATGASQWKIGTVIYNKPPNGGDRLCFDETEFALEEQHCCESVAPIRGLKILVSRSNPLAHARGQKSFTPFGVNA
jgi:hypothetical protein